MDSATARETGADQELSDQESGYCAARIRCRECRVELPVETPASARPAPQPDIGWGGAFALAFVLLYTLTLVAGGGYVFYASIRPVSIPVGGYFASFASLPWIAGGLLILAAWLVGPAVLLFGGLIHLLHPVRRKWWPVVAWVSVLAAGTAIGYVIFHDYRLLFGSAPLDADGTVNGPSRWVPGGPYWQALIATGGQLAVGAVMTALIAATARRGPHRAPEVPPDTP
jgi:hypothetical protein